MLVYQNYIYRNDYGKNSFHYDFVGLVECKYRGIDDYCYYFIQRQTSLNLTMSYNGQDLSV